MLDMQNHDPPTMDSLGPPAGMSGQGPPPGMGGHGPMPTDSRSSQLVGVVISLFIIAFISCALRCYVRLRLMGGFGMDDWLMIMAMMFFTCSTAFALIAANHGSGQHIWTVSHYDQQAGAKYIWFFFMFYFFSIILAKCSTGLFLLRITKQSGKRIYGMVIYTALTLTIVSGIVYQFVAFLFGCRPISYYWNREGDGTCMELEILQATAYMYCGVSILTDFTLTILPLFLIFQLKVGSKTKLILIPIMCMAFVASSAVIVRLTYIESFVTFDITYSAVPYAIWTQVEPGLAITAGSLATLHALFVIILQKLGLSSGKPSIQPMPPPMSAKGAKSNESSQRRSRRSLHEDTLFDTKNDADTGVSVKTSSSTLNNKEMV